MPEYMFERESRTPFSETYAIDADGETVGRVDLHFTASGIVNATLCVPAEYDEEAIEDLIGEVDERLVLTADPYRDDFRVTVWRGEHAGLFSEESEGEDEGDTNGATPHA